MSGGRDGARMRALPALLLLSLAVGCGNGSAPIRVPGAGGNSAIDGEQGGGGDAAGGSGKSGESGESGIPTCSGAVRLPPRNAPCRSQEDCGGGALCQDPLHASIGCAGYAPPECASDSECKLGEVCDSPEHSCRGYSECAPKCSALSCSPGDECAADGKCVPTPCSSGYSCAADRVCDSKRIGADRHGCVPASCKGDGFTCPTGSECKGSIGKDVHDCNVPRCDQGARCAPNTRCDPESQAPNGCAALPCARDEDCDCGSCGMGSCRDEPLECISQLL